MKVRAMFQIRLGTRTSLITFVAIIISLALIHFLFPYGKTHFINSIVCLVIFFTGIWFIRKTLLLFVPDPVVSITLIILIFGTNLFYMAVQGSLLQPVLVFSLYAIIVYLTASVYLTPGLSKIIMLGVFSGLVILVQPTGFLVLLIPILWAVHDRNSIKEKLAGILKNYKELLLSVACLLLVVIFSSLTWKIAPGEISFLGFRLPGLFSFNFRYLWNDLLSFDHGWLIYSPVVLLMVPGFYFLSERNPVIYYPLFVFCLVDILVQSCWTTLGSTEVFGQVAYIPLMAVLSLPLAIFVKVIAEKRRIIQVFVIILCIFFIVLNCFQTWQYVNGIIFRSGMTDETYYRVFGRTDVPETERQQLAGLDPDPVLVLKDGTKFIRRTLAFYDFEDTTATYRNRLEHAFAKSGKWAFKMDSNARFSPAMKVLYSELTKKKQVGARLTVSVFVPKSSEYKDGILVITSIHEGKNYRYRQLRLGDLTMKSGQWQTISFDYLSPIDPCDGDFLEFHVWYTGNASLYIDDLKYEAFEPKE